MSDLQKQTAEQLIERIEYLEVKLAYQDDTIEKLNQSVIVQQNALENLQRKVDVLTEKLKAMQVNDMAPSNEIELPPHY